MDLMMREMRILIAEDVRHTAMQYKISLEEKNHQVITVNNGEDCLTIYQKEKQNKENPFDVVILDYRMPHKDGMIVAKQIRTISPDQRIIFASAYLKEDLVDSVRDLHGIEIIEKPFELEDFVETVERIKK
jgi:DNA-binding NtrC family response regulator